MAVLIKILQLARFGFTPECCFKTSAKLLMFNKYIISSSKVHLLEVAEGSVCEFLLLDLVAVSCQPV